MDILFQAIDEDRPGPKWRAVFDRHWAAYSQWFLQDGARERPTYLASLKALKAHMPELVPAYEAIVAAAGGGDLEARFLSMWCPPTYVGGCSQAIAEGPPPALIRNYDFSPRLLEGTWLASRFTGKRVVAMVDCLWGVLDGVNEDGLAVSLSFGGRRLSGEGFGVPIVLRYVLEFAHNTAEAVAMLQRVPVHMSYTIAVLDREGHHAMVYVNPDRPAEVLARRVSTNHQIAVEWEDHARATRSREREATLTRTLSAPQTAETLLAAFMQPPVYQTSYAKGYGTLYTALYLPQEAAVTLVWPGMTWHQSCASFREDARTIQFADVEPGGSLVAAAGGGPFGTLLS